jgi:hypothetical protein
MNERLEWNSLHHHGIEGTGVIIFEMPGAAQMNNSGKLKRDL